jgi:hypothetical protein
MSGVASDCGSDSHIVRYQVQIAPTDQVEACMGLPGIRRTAYILRESPYQII